MLSWSARIRAAINGETDGTEVRALLASTAPLTPLRQALADRVLEARIAHSDAEWRVALELGHLAAPLWLAENLVTLAGSMIDAETDAHPGQPTLISALSRRQALTVLEPVELIMAELSAALADPTRVPRVPLPLLVGPAATAIDRLSSSVPGPYLRGLLAGAERLGGTAQLAVEHTATTLQSPTTPAWLSAGIQRLRGDLAAAHAHLESQRTRAAALLAGQGTDTEATRRLAMDVWAAIDSFLRIGQTATAPLLLPGAARPTESGRMPAGGRPATGVPDATHARRDPIAQPSAPAVAPTARLTPAPPPEPARPMPEISPTWHGSTGSRDERTTRPAPAAQQQGPRPMPAIGLPAPGAPSHDTVRPMPEIASIQERTSAGPPTAAKRSPTLPGSPLPGSPLPGSPLPGSPSRSGVSPDGASSVSDARPLPEIGAATRQSGQAPTASSATGRRIEPAQRWLLSSAPTRHRLRAAGQEEHAERELAAFWQARAWQLAPAEQRFLDEVAALLASKAIVPSGRSLERAPFSPIYRVTRNNTTVLGRPLSTGQLFAFHGDAGIYGLHAAGDGVPDVP